MDLLTWLGKLPLRLGRTIGHWLAWASRRLFGDFSWSAPRWMRVVGSRPRTSTGIVVAVIVLAVAAWFGWNAYRNRPRPPQVTFDVTAPTVTDYRQQQQKQPIVQPLVVTLSGSAAPIEQVDKIVGQGINVRPALKGDRKWTGDHTLQFTPAADWPMGQHFVGRSAPGGSLGWQPARADSYQVHVVDDRGRSDTRAVRLSLVE